MVNSRAKVIYIFLAAAFCIVMPLGSGVTMAGDPNLVPVRPVGWADKIVVMTASTDYGYTGTVTQMQQVYINFAWENTAVIAAPAHVAKFYIDDSLAFFLNVSAGTLAAGNWMKLGTSQTFTFETTGNHTLKVEIETGGTVDPASVYTRIINVQSDGKVHLRPYLDAGWGDKIVAANVTGATSDTAVYVNELAYLNFAWVNIGTVNAGAGTYTANLYVIKDGNPVGTPLEANQNVTNGGSARLMTDWPYIFTEAGTYTLRLGVQGNGDTQLYTYERTLNVVGNVVNFKPYQPDGWTSTIVVASQAGTNTETGYTPTAGQPSYIDIAWENSSETAAPSVPYTVSLYLSGQADPIYYTVVTTAIPEGGFYVADEDTPYTFTAAGPYTLTLVVDDGNQIAESYENDNVFTRTITVADIAEIPFNLDVDGNGQVTALGDGVMIVRYLFGLRGNTLIVGAIDSVDCQRCTGTEIENYINDAIAAGVFNLDRNLLTTALGDGVMIVRYLFGFRGNTLIEGAIDLINCQRCQATEIENYIESIRP